MINNISALNRLETSYISGGGIDALERRINQYAPPLIQDIEQLNKNIEQLRKTIQNTGILIASSLIILAGAIVFRRR